MRFCEAATYEELVPTGMTIHFRAEFGIEQNDFAPVAAVHGMGRMPERIVERQIAIRDDAQRYEQEDRQAKNQDAGAQDAFRKGFVLHGIDHKGGQGKSDSLPLGNL